MRLAPEQIKLIKQLIAEIAGDGVSVRVFGSRIDDSQRGGDLDILLELPCASKNPAWLAARVSAKISRIMLGRKVDVLITAPNLKELPIHKHAKSTGVQI